MSIRHEVNLSIKPVDSFTFECQGKVSDYFGTDTFSENVMKRMISEKTFNAFKQWQEEGISIKNEQADEIANAMKEWAMNKGANSYSHWFQPMTGQTAEKHDSFISVNGTGQILEKLTGTKLIQGEPDASSFPSGGLRVTFEARGYTAWDPSSPAFIISGGKGKTLCIPTIFISYTGEALDKKLPLLRSEQALNKAACAMLRLFGNSEIKNVYSTCGPEQEYFLIDQKYYKMRTDLQLTGRTLIGAPSPKGQQLEDQYFGSIKDRVIGYMNEVGSEAHRLGIPVTTRHNEVAPHQYEFAPYYERSNLAADHNILLMDIMRKVAKRHGLECLLHEKPFAGINGSGKHVNWALSDEKGSNLLNPGETPEENLQFLTFLVAVIQAVNKHGDLLRLSVASAGNEHRLGANEAPPAIMSVYLGEHLNKVITNIESGTRDRISKQDIVDFGIGHLPKFFRDTTDRNRTSPFAFTGMKFEFRAVGSSFNISNAITIINSIIADSLNNLNEKISAAMKKDSFENAVLTVLSAAIKENKPILFEGNNYSEEWHIEAARRGLPNEPSTAGALTALVDPENIKLFERLGVFSKTELLARHNIWLDIYNKVLDIEAKTLIDMVNSSVLPPAYEFQYSIGKTVLQITEISKNPDLKLNPEVLNNRKELYNHISDVILFVNRNIKILQEMVKKAESMHEEERANFHFNELKPHMEHIRRHVDDLETFVPDSEWQLPKYKEMLFIC
ncbi:MAG: glutamine synthetase type III [Fibrobacter sp.]|nr:glutamine synthetase type III [Fibrobacter sp.]